MRLVVAPYEPAEIAPWQTADRLYFGLARNSKEASHNLGGSMLEKHLGGCVCGAVRYQVTGSPVVGTVCHCKFCQKRLASAFAMLASFKHEAIEFLKGEVNEIEHRSDESGRWLRMRFCPKCGTTVAHTAEIRPGMMTIAAGTFDDPSWFTIDRHIWVQSKLPWVSIPAGVASYMQGYVPPAT